MRDRDTKRKLGREERGKPLEPRESLPHLQDMELSDRCEAYGMCASAVTEDEPGIEKLLGNMEAARIMPYLLLQNHALLGTAQCHGQKGYGSPCTLQAELLHPTLLQD